MSAAQTYVETDHDGGIAVTRTPSPLSIAPHRPGPAPAVFPVAPADYEWTAQPHPTAEFVLLTPETAAVWLDLNDINRRRERRQVEKFAHDMTAGDWAVTGEAIKFSADGSLLDGQHRVVGVVDSGVSIVTLVVRGLDVSAQKYMDSGQARSTAQRFALMGEKYSAVLAAVAHLGVRIERIGRESDPYYAVSQSEQEHWVVDNPAVRPVVERWNASAPRGVTKTAFSYVAFRVLAVDQEMGELFLVGLATGADLPAGSPILAARTRLANMRADGVQRPVMGVVDLLFRAWNQWMRGQGSHKMPFRAAVRELPALAGDTVAAVADETAEIA